MSAALPVRLQLSRKKGFDLQAHSRAVNGLPAFNCSRPGRFGNQFKVGRDGCAHECRDLFRVKLEAQLAACPLGAIIIRQMLDELRGKNVACWCGLGEPCHGDVWLEIANRPLCEGVAK
jgi:hypothetical protein